MNCRSCGSAKTEKVFDLGKMPLANNLLSSPEDTLELYPLELAFCQECTLVQLVETVPPEKMFTEYLYLTSYSTPMVKQAEELVVRMINERGVHGLNKDSLVMEIGSNDGYLLQHYKLRGIPIVGIEPAENVARIAHKKGIHTLIDYFDSVMAEAFLEKADIIHANNVLAHVPDLNDFVKGIALVLKPDGVAVVEVPYVRSLIEKVEFDTIYHEHVYYFSLTALYHLFFRHGLFIINVEFLGTHGGSLRVFVAHEGSSPSINTGPGAEQRIQDTLIGEAELARGEYYAAFSAKASTLIKQIRSLVVSANEDGKSVAGFGAAAKATILLNACQLTKEDVRYVVDETPTKQGKYIPGVSISIIGLGEFERLPRADYLLILCWNFAEQVMKRFSQFKGRFIIPLPEPHVE